jgi:hypothetical protein
MLDVHPPHEAAHTWKDFFIHVGTICVGLLIAVGLEQSIEAFHRATERRELLHDLHTECERNIKMLVPDLISYRGLVDWDTRAVIALRSVPVVGGSITVTLPAQSSHPGPPHAPSRAVWAVAKSSGKVALLPESQAEAFDRVDLQAEQFRLAADRTNAATRALANFDLRTGTTVEPGATLHLTPAQRDDLLASLTTNITEALGTINWVASWQGASEAVLDGVTDQDEMSVYMDRARAAAIPH